MNYAIEITDKIDIYSEVRENTIICDSIEDVIFNRLYINVKKESLKNCVYKAQGCEKLVSDLIKKDKKDFIFDLLLFPVIYIIIDMLILNRIWAWIMRIIGIQYLLIYSIIMYLLIFLINGILQFVEYNIDKNKRMEMPKCFEDYNIKSMFENKY